MNDIFEIIKWSNDPSDYSAEGLFKEFNLEFTKENQSMIKPYYDKVANATLTNPNLPAYWDYNSYSFLKGALSLYKQETFNNKLEKLVNE